MQQRCISHLRSPCLTFLSVAPVFVSRGSGAVNCDGGTLIAIRPYMQLPLVFWRQKCILKTFHICEKIYRKPTNQHHAWSFSSLETLDVNGKQQLVWTMRKWPPLSWLETYKQAHVVVNRRQSQGNLFQSVSAGLSGRQEACQPDVISRLWGNHEVSGWEPSGGGRGRTWT